MMIIEYDLMETKSQTDPKPHTEQIFPVSGQWRNLRWQGSRMRQLSVTPAAPSSTICFPLFVFHYLFS